MTSVITTSATPPSAAPGPPVSPLAPASPVSPTAPVSPASPPPAATAPLPGLHVLRLEPAQLPALLAMLGRCSRQTLFHRFHGLTDGVPYAVGLVGAPGQSSLTAWSQDLCVGLATLAEGPSGHELGVLVEDAWQRRGVGTALVAALLASARAHGVGEIVADVLAEDAFVVAALRRLGPVRTTLECGVYAARVVLVSGAASTPPRCG